MGASCSASSLRSFWRARSLPKLKRISSKASLQNWILYTTMCSHFEPNGVLASSDHMLSVVSRKVARKFHRHSRCIVRKKRHELEMASDTSARWTLPESAAIFRR